MSNIKKKRELLRRFSGSEEPTVDDVALSDITAALSPLLTECATLEIQDNKQAMKRALKAIPKLEGVIKLFKGRLQDVRDEVVSSKRTNHRGNRNAFDKINAERKAKREQEE